MREDLHDAGVVDLRERLRDLQDACVGVVEGHYLVSGVREVRPDLALARGAEGAEKVSVVRLRRVAVVQDGGQPREVHRRLLRNRRDDDRRLVRRIVRTVARALGNEVGARIAAFIAERVRGPRAPDEGKRGQRDLLALGGVRKVAIVEHDAALGDGDGDRQRPRGSAAEDAYGRGPSWLSGCRQGGSPRVRESELPNPQFVRSLRPREFDLARGRRRVRRDAPVGCVLGDAPVGCAPRRRLPRPPSRLTIGRRHLRPRSLAVVRGASSRLRWQRASGRSCLRRRKRLRQRRRPS